MEPTVYKYIIRYSMRQQVVLIALAGLSFPFLYFFYELPKMIVNGAISGKAGPFPVEIFGLELGQPAYLLGLCGLFLVLVLINQSFKYVINVYKGLTGERMLRRLRYELYSRIVRFPLPTFRKMSQGEIIPMITAEVEPLGGFIGDAFSLPAFQGGQLLVILGFLFIQNPIMAAAAVALYPLQVYIIPRLQKRVNLLGKERVRLVRKLSDRIGETVQGVQEIHAHDTSNLEMADFSDRLGTIFGIRYKIYRQKFVIKFINNFIQQLGPFFFYSIGGYLVITGGLDIGTLMAAIAAHKDLAGPWKELLTYYQMKEDARIKYDTVISQFQPAGMRDQSYQLDQPDEIPRLKGELTTANLTLTDEQDVNVLDGISLKVQTSEHIAIVGPSGSGKEDLAMLLARLIDPSKGSISVNGSDIGTMPEAVTGRRISFVGASSYIFAGTLGDNLFYGLKHRPNGVGGEDSRGSDWISEAEAAGNMTYDINADWIDYSVIGVDGQADLTAGALRVLKMVDLVDDVYRLGLRGTINPTNNPDLTESILRARTALVDRTKDPEVATLIEPFDREKYNTNATVGENLLFGNPIDERFDMERLAENQYVLSVLDNVGLTEQMLSIGYQVAATMVELFADVPPDHELFQQFSFISSEDLPDFQALVTRVDRDSLDQLTGEDRASLMSLPFKLIPARHRLGLVNEELQPKLLEAREVFARDLPEDLQDAVEFFDRDAYNRAANLQDNILFGKIAYGQAEAGERVGGIISEVIEQLELRDTVAEVGLGFDVGIAGSKLGAAQRQKLAIARAVLKNPDVLILSEATASLDGGVQTRILANLTAEFEGRGLIWSLHRADLAKDFDRIVVMKGGKAVEVGTYDELNKDGTSYKELAAAE